MPFLIDGSFAVVGKSAIAYYLVEKAGRMDLFGKSIEDVVRINSMKNKRDCHNAVLALNANLRSTTAV